MVCLIEVVVVVESLTEVDKADVAEQAEEEKVVAAQEVPIKVFITSLKPPVLRKSKL